MLTKIQAKNDWYLVNLSNFTIITKINSGFAFEKKKKEGKRNER